MTMSFKCRECGKMFNVSLPFGENVCLGVVQFLITLHMLFHHREYMTTQKTIAAILTMIKGFLCFIFELFIKAIKAVLFVFYWLYTSIDTRWY